MAAPPAVWAFGAEEDQDFSFEDQLAQQESFEDEEERWAAYAAALQDTEGQPRADPVEREEATVSLPVDELASQQAAFGKSASIQALSFIMYLLFFDSDPDLFRNAPLSLRRLLPKHQPRRGARAERRAHL